MDLDFVIVLPYVSVNVQLSVTVPPQAPAGDCELNVEVTEPLIKHPPLLLLV